MIYPLTDPMVNPDTKYRDNDINNIVTGILTTTAPAAYSPHWVDRLAWNDFKPKGKVYKFGFCKTIAAMIYSLQLVIKLNNAVITPHIASYAKEIRVEMETEAANNLLKGLQNAKEWKQAESISHWQFWIFR